MAIRRGNNFEDMFIHFDRIHDRDRHTQALHDSVGRACIASCGKNQGFASISPKLLYNIEAIVTVECQ